MLCQSCQKHPATVHQIEVDWDESNTPQTRTLHLCPTCAKAAGVPVPGNVPSFPKVMGMLGKVLLSPQIIKTEGKSKACPACGWTLRDFRQTSRFGCPQDYEVFAEFVNELLERIHGTSEHPTSPEAAELAGLQKTLADAVSREDYEEAARIRDRINTLQGNLENPQESA